MSKFLFKLLVWLPLLALLSSCGSDKDDDATMTIYGDYTGVAERQSTDTTTGANTRDESAAKLSVVKFGDDMSIGIVGGNIDFKLNGLPRLDVSGSEDYHYQFTSKDGNVLVDIASPDFKKITVTIKFLVSDENKRVEYYFSGTRDSGKK